VALALADGVAKLLRRGDQFVDAASPELVELPNLTSDPPPGFDFGFKPTPVVPQAHAIQSEFEIASFDNSTVHEPPTQRVQSRRTLWILRAEKRRSTKSRKCRERAAHIVVRDRCRNHE
jgi:hypothetical protein